MKYRASTCASLALFGLTLVTAIIDSLACDARAEPASSNLHRATRGSSDNAAFGEKWVRLLRDENGNPAAMQTAIVRYVPRQDVDRGKKAADYEKYVDLVGAVHVADRAYYDALNRRFKGYEAVLYELVAEQGTAVPQSGASSSHPLGALQNGMKSLLEVEHQLEMIDYSRPNFVHADLSPDEFMQSMEKRDEGFIEMYFKILGASLAQQSQQAAEGDVADIDFMAALVAPDRSRQLKIVMAKQFEGMEQMLVGLSGPEGSTLITERNRRALDVLEDQLDAGKNRMAIFYGAGHLSDMHQQLSERFGMEPVARRWIDAWDLRK